MKRSDYRKYLPGLFIYKKKKNPRLKTEKKCRFFWGIFSSVTMNDLTMAVTSRLIMDVKCANQHLNWIRLANYVGTPPAD